MDVEEEEVENSILEKLKKRAQILKELGGEIPEEIKDLLEPETDEGETKHKNDKIENQEVLSSTKSQEPNIDSKEEIISSNQETAGLGKEEFTNETYVKDYEKSITANEMEVAIDSKIDFDKTSQIDSAVNSSKLEKAFIQEQTVSSISLIAGYGNEDDSETEDDKLTNTGISTPLFPIVDSEKENSTKVPNMKVIKLSAKAKELINSSTTTGRARATEFNATSDGLKSEVFPVKGKFKLDV